MSLQFSDDAARDELSALMDVPAVSSITDFIENNRELLSSKDKSTSLKGEIALNKYVQTFFIPVINSLVARIKALLADKDGAEGLSKEERLVYNSYHSQLLKLGEKLQETTTKTARLVKYAVEVEAVKSSRLDSIELLGLLQQIPALVTTTLEAALIQVIDEIQREVEGNFVSEAHIRDLHSRCKYFGRLRDLAVSEVLEGVMSQLNDKLSEVRIDKSGSGKAGVSGVSMEELKRKEVLGEMNSMLDTVPTGTEDCSPAP